jgi:indoleamine 2,3-dioxygenase
MDTLDNLATHMTFTGSLDESWFYLVSVAIEARAGPIVPMMLEAIAAARRKDVNTVVQALRSFAERLDELGALLERMYESCDPHVFYHRIRPFLAGSKNMADAGLPQGVMFDDGTGEQPYVQFSGGSNAQSSIIQFFDVVLGVEHRPTGEKRSDVPTPDSGAVQSPPHGFIQDMRRYMPGTHRRFLERMEEVANIREFVNSNRSNRALTTSYDACLAMLRSLRDKHIQLVSRYIIIKSRETRSSSRSLSPQQAKNTRVNLANTLASGGSKKLRGTGGTALIPFLKQARDETGEPAIDAWARRLLNNGPGDIGASSFEDGFTRIDKINDGLNGEVQIVGLAGTWSVDDSEGGVSFRRPYYEKESMLTHADLPLVILVREVHFLRGPIGLVGLVTMLQIKKRFNINHTVDNLHSFAVVHTLIPPKFIFCNAISYLNRRADFPTLMESEASISNIASCLSVPHEAKNGAYGCATFVRI